MQETEKIKAHNQISKNENLVQVCFFNQSHFKTKREAVNLARHRGFLPRPGRPLLSRSPHRAPRSLVLPPSRCLALPRPAAQLPPELGAGLGPAWAGALVRWGGRGRGGGLSPAGWPGALGAPPGPGMRAEPTPCHQPSPPCRSLMRSIGPSWPLRSPLVSAFD